MKTLYRYHNMKVEKHRLTKDCVLSEELENLHGILYRCRICLPNCKCYPHDFYGYRTLKEAKLEAIETVRQEIYTRQGWLKKVL